MRCWRTPHSRARGGVEDEEPVPGQVDANRFPGVTGEILRRLDGDEILTRLGGDERVIADEFHRVDLGCEMALPGGNDGAILRACAQDGLVDPP